MQVKKSAVLWAKSIWNWLDVIVISLYWIAFAIRMISMDSSSNEAAAKVLLASANLPMWIRLARFYEASEFLGPKVIMIQRMGRDVYVFLMLLMLVVLGYGVAEEIILHPARSIDGQTFTNVFYRPFFQIFGNLFLEELQEESRCLGSNSFSSCDTGQAWLLPAFLALYLLATVIVLVNLLIAMFNDTVSIGVTWEVLNCQPRIGHLKLGLKPEP